MWVARVGQTSQYPSRGLLISRRRPQRTLLTLLKIRTALLLALLLQKSCLLPRSSQRRLKQVQKGRHFKHASELLLIAGVERRKGFM